MAALAGPFRYAATSGPYLDMIAFNTAADGDTDFTAANSITLGYCPRAIYATGAGDISFYAVGGLGSDGVTPTPTIRVVTVAAKSFLPVGVGEVTNTNTNATGLFACL